MDLLYLILLFISMMVEEIYCVIMKRVDMKSSNEEKTLFESDEESLLQCAQRCKFIDSDAKIDFRNSRCRCIKYQTDDELQNHGTLTELFVAQKIMKMKEPINGGWSSWINSTECTKTCGNGTIEQKRRCDSPKPEHGGDDCKGRGNKTVHCNTHECPIVNIALGKASAQSSTHGPHPSSDALDGNNVTRCGTKKDIHPWWEVDLGEVKVIKSIRLTAFVWPTVNEGLIVETRRNVENSWTLCSDIGNLKVRYRSFKCTNEQSSIARFLRIRSTRLNYLRFFEVEIFGN